MGKLIESDGDVHEIYHKDESNGKFHVELVQDVEKYLNANKTEINDESSNWKGDFHKVASIPEVVIAQWWKELGSNPLSKENKNWFIAKLNSSEFKSFRTKSGRV